MHIEFLILCVSDLVCVYRYVIKGEAECGARYITRLARYIRPLVASRPSLAPSLVLLCMNEVE